MSKSALMAGSVIAAILVSSVALADAPEMLNVRWGKNAFNFEPMPTGVQPLRNLSRRPDGTANAGQLVGDYKNPILTPFAANIVKQKGELATAGVGFRNSQDQCRPIGPPFSLAMGTAWQMVPGPNGDLTIIYDQNANMRHIRMNGTHPATLKPSATGDSIGHWDGDTLIIDTVGVRVDPFTSVDRFGTPQTEAMHTVERYRLIDGVTAKAQVDKFEFDEGTVGGGGRNGGGRNAGYNPDTGLKGLELDITIEDPTVFTQPLTARVTYRRLVTQLEENVCADNPVDHYKDEWIGLPRAEKSDF